MFREFIIDSGETQAIWAKRLGVGQAYLSLLLNNKKTPSLDLAVRIQRATEGAVPADSWVSPCASSLAPSDAARDDEAAA